MLNIGLSSSGTKLTIFLDGRLDTDTAPSLERKLKEDLKGVTELIIDADKLEYISSDGLRTLLNAQKIMDKQGTLVIINVSNEVYKAFESTGFSNILNVKRRVDHDI